MKRQILIFLGAFFFSTLFYEQGFGLNMLLFAIVSVAMVLLFQPEAWRRRDLRLAAVPYLASSVFVFTVSSWFSVLMCLFTFLVFVGTVSGFRNTVYVQWFNGIYQLFFGALHQRLKNGNLDSAPKKKYNYGFLVFTGVIVLGAVSLFAVLYGEANPILQGWLSYIDLSAINFSWLVTTAMGYFLLLNITSKAELDVMTTIDREARTILLPKPIKEEHKPTLQKEIVLGTALLTALNILIVLFIATDLSYLFSNPMEDAVALSKTVHQGVSALITSIVVAISIILILFRGDLNFYKNSEKLRVLTYCWIAFNIVIILFTLYKNYLYSSGFGLTYKRIGVFVYLLLCISGMVTTYFKISRKHNFLFMIQSNARIAFMVLVLIASFHWDRTITTYNLQLEHPDMYYLTVKLENNEDLLYAFAKAYPEKSVELNTITDEYKQWQERLSRQTWQSKTLLGLLNQKNKHYELSYAN